MGEHDSGTMELEAGWQALAAGDWPAAHRHFEQALTDGESPEGFEGLGWAAYCLDNDPVTFDARERAFRLYRKRGDDASAARVAAWLAADWLEFRGDASIANGWLRRAHRLLEGLDTCPEHGWLAVHEASILVGDDPETARRLASEAVELGRRFGVHELVMVGLGLEGVSLVSLGDLHNGMRLLDEAAAAALSEPVELLVCVAWACCYLIAACEQVGDYERAGEWCRRVGGFCEQHGIALPLSVCRAKYAGVLTRQGRWDEAEHELTLAVRGLESARPALVGDALVRKAELRRRQGRIAEAVSLLARCEGDPVALLVESAIALDLGRAADAAEGAERFLRRFPEPIRMERCAGLEVAIRAYALLGKHDKGARALQQLRDVATRSGTRMHRAAVLHAEAFLAESHGNAEDARCALEDTLDLLAPSGAPYELARVRLDLARVLETTRRMPAARREAEAALAAFRALGADGEAQRAATMLSRLEPDSTAAHDGPLAVLSPREREVLALVATGLTNAQVAERLTVSEHTVHRHVTNLLRKLGLPSRSAAASLATRHGLV